MDRAYQAGYDHAIADVLKWLANPKTGCEDYRPATWAICAASIKRKFSKAA
jgi:hypothetical protein